MEKGPITAGSVLRAWPVMLGAFVLVLGGLLLYISRMPVTYASNSVVAFEPQPGRADGRDLISLLVQTYPQMVASEQFVSTAAAAAGVTPGEVKSGLDVQIPPLTLTMTIQTEMPDPRVAQTVNQSLLDQTIAQGKQDQFLVATAISNADLPESPSGVSAKLLYAVAALLSAGVAMLAGISAARLGWPRPREASSPSP